MSTSSIASKLDALPGLAGAKRAVRRLSLPESGVHAVLLYGSRGAGKRDLAEVLLQSWLCTDPTDEGACGRCQACGAYANGRNADLLVVRPGGLGDLIRLYKIAPADWPKTEPPGISVQEFLRTGPLMSRRKVVLIENAERLNRDAGNALLKMLEEPHPYARFVLLSASVGRILPTILSRCVAIACELPPPEEKPDSAADMFWRLAQGAPGLAERYERDQEAFQALIRLAESFPKRTAAEALKVSEEFRDIAALLAKDDAVSGRAANAETLEVLATFVSQRFPERQSWRVLIAEAHRRILGNAGAAYVFDSLFARMFAKGELE